MIFFPDNSKYEAQHPRLNRYKMIDMKMCILS